MKQINNELKEIIKAVKKHIEIEDLAGSGDLLIKGEKAQENLTLEALKENVSVCTKCDLSKTRTNVVFGAGSSRAKLMFVGEAPGMQEDLQAMPFVGRAGKLLTKIIESIGLKRQDAYIANILKCRPPENRNPLPMEILSCEGYLIKQIELIKPKVICALGKFAAQALLRSQEPISKLRGRFFDYHGAKLMPTFHPAYLLRNSSGGKRDWLWLITFA